MEKVKIKGKYLHFKGKYYRVHAIVRDSENPQRQLVIYEALFESPEFGKNQLWCRDIDNFTGNKELPDGKIIKRFTYIPEK